MQWLLPMAFCLYAFSTLISMAVMSIGAAILALAVIVCIGPRRLFVEIKREWTSSLWFRRYVAFSVALMVLCIGSLISAKISPLSYDGKISPVHFFGDSAKLWYFVWPVILLVGLKGLAARSREQVLRAWVATSAVLGVVAIFQHFTGWPRPQIIPSGSGIHYHATLFLGHHLSVASIFIFPFFYSLDRFRKNRDWLYGAGAIFGAIALFLTYSRTLWAALPIAIVIWAMLNLPRKATVSLVIALLIGAAGAWQVGSVRARFETSQFLYGGWGPRNDLWKANFDFLKERPLLGVGWKHNQELSGYYLLEKHPGQTSVFSGHAHNNLIDMLGGTGILGALAWLAWSVFAMALAWRAGSSGFFCAWIAFHINGLTQVNFWEAKVTHQLMWVVALSLLWVSKDERP